MSKKKKRKNKYPTHVTISEIDRTTVCLHGQRGPVGPVGPVSPITIGNASAGLNGGFGTNSKSTGSWWSGSEEVQEKMKDAFTGALTFSEAIDKTLEGFLLARREWIKTEFIPRYLGYKQNVNSVIANQYKSEIEIYCFRNNEIVHFAPYIFDIDDFKATDWYIIPNVGGIK